MREKRDVAIRLLLASADILSPWSRDNLQTPTFYEFLQRLSGSAGRGGSRLDE
jgi:hypothetical protein